MTTQGSNRGHDADQDTDTGAPLSESIAAQEPDAGEVDEDSIPVHGSEKKADDLAEEAYGDKDDDGNADVPNAPFPG